MFTASSDNPGKFAAEFDIWNLAEASVVTLGVARCAGFIFFFVLSSTWKRAESAGWSVVAQACQ